MTGRLYGVGLGPGDPELITRKAARLIESADVIAFHAGVGKHVQRPHHRRRADPADGDRGGAPLPRHDRQTEHPGGYAGAMAEFYESCSARLAAHLEAGRTVVVLAEGDPLFYGSFMYLHDRLAPRFETEVVPGVPAFAAATAVLASPLVRQTDVLTVLPGTLPVPELARRLADTDGAIIMKLGRRFPGVVDALRQAGRLEHAMYVERASMPAERWMPVVDVDAGSVPYFSLVVVPGDSVASDPGGRRAAVHSLVEERARPLVEEGRSRAVTKPSPLKVIGLGPGPDKWLTPEAQRGTGGRRPRRRLRPVRQPRPAARRPHPPRLGQHRRGRPRPPRPRPRAAGAPSGRRVRRGRGSLRDGERGVRGGRGQEVLPDVPVEVLPGVSAVQAVAARAGAPVGADFAVVSLSDRLKPWPVIEKRLHAIAEADLVLAVYNPASRSRTTQVADLQKLFLEHRSPDTVVIVGRDVGRAEESLTVTTLAELEADTIDMKCLLIIGASSTTVTAAGQVWTPRFVE